MSLEVFAEEIALSIGGILVTFRLYKIISKRKEVTSWVQELDALNQRFRKENKIYSDLSRRIHFWQTLIGGVMTMIGAAIGIPQALFALYTQKLYYDHILPLNTSAMSFNFYLVWAFQFFTVVSCTIGSTLLECIVIDWFVQLSFCFFVQNHKASLLRKSEKLDEEVEFEKLLEIIKTHQQLER